jgi:hypothetical protein
MHSRIKRRDSRYPIMGKFEASELPSFQARRKGNLRLSGQVHNISDGGFCLHAARAPRESSLLQGLLEFADVPARIPTLVQVRWVNRLANEMSYRIGLKYVI